MSKASSDGPSVASAAMEPVMGVAWGRAASMPPASHERDGMLVPVQLAPCHACPHAIPPSALPSQWLGGPSYPGTDGMSVCADFLLSVRCDQAAEGASAAGGNGSGGGKKGSAACTEAHQWLQHAFSLDQPCAGDTGCASWSIVPRVGQRAFASLKCDPWHPPS